MISKHYFSVFIICRLHYNFFFLKKWYQHSFIMFFFCRLCYNLKKRVIIYALLLFNGSHVFIFTNKFSWQLYGIPLNILDTITKY